MKKLFSVLAVLFAMAVFITACGGGGGGGGTSSGGGGTTTTTVSGKVTLSSSVAQKPSALGKVFAAASLNASALNGATIELYNADKPEWLYPVATAMSTLTGDYSLSTLANAGDIAHPEYGGNFNADGTAPYKNGDPIPVGNYTIIASKYDNNYGKLFVAVQAVVKKFSGVVVGNDLVAQDSDAIPAVASMFGLAKNTDGTYGSSTIELPNNTAIQITFSMAMARVSVVDAASIADSSGDPVAGKWKVSPDLMSVTFYPVSPLTPSKTYTVTLTGGKALKTANNVYGKPIPATVKGTFKAAATDKTPPTAVRNRPTNTEKNAMPLSTPIEIAADEALDINTIKVTATPTLGDKPAVQFIGKVNASNPYIYQIIPSVALAYDTTYTVTVSEGKDLAGLAMDVLNFSFTTEPKPAVIAGTTSEVDAKTAVANIVGKWINAMNSRNVTLLTSYMTGDFYWLNDPAQGKSSEDLNRDGRMSLQEFTLMLEKWFTMLGACDTTITGTVAEITLSNGDKTAVAKFSLDVATANTTNPSCSDAGGPDSYLYAELQNLNGAWIMTRGSDYAPPAGVYPAPLKGISLVAPINGAQYDDPTVTLKPVQPEFQWSVPTLGTTDPAITSYMVVVVDNKSPWQQSGWVAIVDAGSAAAGSTMQVKFNPMPGDYGNVLVLNFDNGGGEPLGFGDAISEFRSGGNYSWAVLGFHTKTIADFKNINFDPSLYTTASSNGNNFSVAGVWKELKVVLQNAAGAAFTFNEMMNSYDLGSTYVVNAIITTPTASTSNAYYQIEGYTPSRGPLTFTNGVATLPVTLSQGRTSMRFCDDFDKSNWQCRGLSKEFEVYTTGGAAPKINITSVTGKKCDMTISNLGTKDAWNQYTTADTCYITITGTVHSSITGTLNLHVHNENDNGQHNGQYWLTGTTFTFTDVPVFNGRNWIGLSDEWQQATESSTNQTNMSVNTLAGATYVQPIAVSIAGITKTGSNMNGATYDAGIVSSITLSITMQAINTNCGSGNCANWYQTSDPNDTQVAGGSGPITTTYASIPVTLKQGWNNIGINDGLNHYYSVKVFTSGGQPNITHMITKLDGVTATKSMGFYTSTSADCSVVISGTTPNAGPINVYINNYSTPGSPSISEWLQGPDAAANVEYNVPVTVYDGVNDISLSDATGVWQGVRITTTGPVGTCAAAVFSVTGIKSGTTSLPQDSYGDYNAGSSSTVTIEGTVKSGRAVTVNVSGQYYTTHSATVNGTSYTATVPVYNGYNNISINDGYNWIYKTVYTSGGSVYTPPISNVSVTPGYLTSGGGPSETSAMWNTSASTVTVTGKTDSSGEGSYYVNGSSYTFNSSSTANPSFSFALDLLYGWNYITIYDSKMNIYNLSIYTTGGVGAPVQYVTITSPQHNAAITTTGPITVTGNIALNQGFTPQYIYGYVYDNTTYTSLWFSSDPADQQYGDLPIIYNAGTGSFTFTTQISGGHTTYIYVVAEDINYNQHYHEIYVNNSSQYGSSYNKTGLKPTGTQAISNAHKAEFLKHIRR